MKALRLALMVVVLVGIALGPAHAAYARTGNPLSPPELVKWLASADAGKVHSWDSLYNYAIGRLASSDPRIAREVQQVVSRAQLAGRTTPCSTEFLGERIQEDLTAIANRESGIVSGVVGPAVCAVTLTPEVVGGYSMATAPHPDRLEIYGYNFGAPFGTPRVYVTHRTGVVPLWNQQQATGHNVMIVDLTDGIGSLCALQDANLVVSWDDKGLYQTPMAGALCAAAGQ